ncbi:hypothetical protein [Halalkalibacter oceani]|uniref:hypothetical protein n=1 Tax=Halalkalibacter oceani TaxID=1653776 RepID=UPI0033911910
MPEFSLPFDSIASDEREYPAEQFVQYLKPLINTGILTDPDTLKVEAREGMTVQVQTGYAWIEGYVYSLYDVPLPVTLAGADNSLDRIDRIVLRLDLSLSARSIEVRVLQGEPAANPVPPALTREGNIYELSLAQVRVVGGRSFIDDSDIMDERGDKELCPLVSSNILPSITDALQIVIDRLDAHIGAGGDAHAIATPTEAGFMSAQQVEQLEDLTRIATPGTAVQELYNTEEVTYATHASRSNRQGYDLMYQGIRIILKHPGMYRIDFQYSPRYTGQNAPVSTKFALTIENPLGTANVLSYNGLLPDGFANYRWASPSGTSPNSTGVWPGVSPLFQTTQTTTGTAYYSATLTMNRRVPANTVIILSAFFASEYGSTGTDTNGSLHVRNVRVRRA